MSLRPKSAPLPAATASIIKIIEDAKAAHAAWNKDAGATISAPSSWREATVESYQPWELTFKQTVSQAGTYGALKVEHEIKLTEGVYSRLDGMVEALTPLFKKAYEGANWSSVAPGKVYTVCSKPDDSYGKWSFSIPISGADSSPGWYTPGSATNPEGVLRSVTGTRMGAGDIIVDINDVTYNIKERYPEVVGERAVFKIERASFLRDKVKV